MFQQEFVIVSLLLFCASATNKNVTLPVTSEAPESTPQVPSALIKKYELNSQRSKVLCKDDRKLMTEWSSEFQVKRLDVSMVYRVQVIKHEEHSFTTDGNQKWTDCLFIHRKEIRRAKRLYHDAELHCLRESTSRDEDMKKPGEQLDKEIVKWRKGYKYLVNLCNSENSGNKENAQQCLVDYMQSDNYDEVIERLMVLKQTAMGNLYSYYETSLVDLDQCLKTQLSRYLERVRQVMATLNKCYTISGWICVLFYFSNITKCHSSVANQSKHVTHLRSTSLPPKCT